MLYVATVQRFADLIANPKSISFLTRDPNDDYLVVFAREHGADYIVTGHKDLLEWPERRPPVITPPALAELVGE